MLVLIAGHFNFRDFLERQDLPVELNRAIQIAHRHPDSINGFDERQRGRLLGGDLRWPALRNEEQQQRQKR